MLEGLIAEGAEGNVVGAVALDLGRGPLPEGFPFRLERQPLRLEIAGVFVGPLQGIRVHRHLIKARRKLPHGQLVLVDDLGLLVTESKLGDGILHGTFQVLLLDLEELGGHIEGEGRQVREGFANGSTHYDRSSDDRGRIDGHSHDKRGYLREARAQVENAIPQEAECFGAEFQGHLRLAQFPDFFAAGVRLCHGIRVGLDHRQGQLAPPLERFVAVLHSVGGQLEGHPRLIAIRQGLLQPPRDRALPHRRPTRPYVGILHRLGRIDRDRACRVLLLVVLRDVL